MGHQISYMEFSENATKEEMLKERADYIECNGERDWGGTLLSSDNGFTLHNVVCDSYDDAIDKIAEYDKGFYDDHGVKFKEYPRTTPTKGMIALKERIEAEQRKRNEYIESHSVRLHKADYIGCKECGIKVSRRHLRGERCPVCGEELRASYIIERIENFDAKIKKLEDEYRSMARKRSKPVIKWLVKIEIHV